jgi:amino acid transporter
MAHSLGVRLGVMLALFSFVGFESATALGSEAKEPLKTIPRAVVQSAVLAGVFFVVCAYGEVQSFHGVSPGLGESLAPMRYLSQHAGVSIAGPVIDAGVLVSMFAATLACVIAAARVLMLMAHHGLAHGRFARTHVENETPGAASVLTGVLAFLPVAVLAWRGSSGADSYGWMGTLAVYGFLTIYGCRRYCAFGKRCNGDGVGYGGNGLSSAPCAISISPVPLRGVSCCGNESVATASGRRRLEIAYHSF